MARTDFYPLTVARVDPLTADSAAVIFDVPPGLAEQFAFAPGQSLTIRRDEERRSYSICAAQGRAPRIGVREVAGGYKMATKVEHHEAVRAFVKKLTPPLKLSLPVAVVMARGMVRILKIV